MGSLLMENLGLLYNWSLAWWPWKPVPAPITGRLKDALGLIDVRLLDHLVVGELDVTSLAERGQI
jgi:hypothetical protein